MARRSSQPDVALLAVGWGMLWGVALGFWLLAPEIVDAHRIQIETLGQRVVLTLALTFIFAALGGFLTLIAGLALAGIEAAIAGPFRDRTWAYGLFGGVLLVVAYTLDSILIHWTNFHSLDDLRRVQSSLAAFIASCVVASVVLGIVYRKVTTRFRSLRPRALAWTLAGLAVTGAVALALRSAALLPAPDIGALRARQPQRDDVPLLFVGIDGATWRLLQPAIEGGTAPTLRALADRGTTGTVEALWPPYWSGAAWAAILTGLPREVTGVYEDLAGIAPGLPPFQIPIVVSLRLNPIYSVRSLLAASGVIEPALPPRSLLRGKPVWELLHDAGVDTAVVRFRFTHPPAAQMGVTISDRVGNDGWTLLGVRRDPVPEAVTPASRADELLAPFKPQARDADLFQRLLPTADLHQPADALLDPFEQLRISSDIDTRTFEVSERIVRTSPAQPFLAVYFAGLDSVEHAFWQYRFPGDYTQNPPAPADVERLGAVLDRYVRYIDDRLGQLLALYSQPPNVLIVSDHGHGATTFSTAWRGWHERDGVFLASGPSIPHDVGPRTVSYYDIVPTIAALKGFEAPEQLTGRAVVTAPVQATPPR